MIVCKKCGSLDFVNNGAGRIKCRARGCNSTVFIDMETSELANNLAKSKQKLMDMKRIGDKAYRHQSRVSNALENYSAELVKVVSENKVKDIRPVKVYKEGAVVIVQISDTHFNELISLPNNSYDFSIASSRLKEYAKRIKAYANAVKCRKIVVFSTGDLLNSDRRLDELLNQATNRANASYLSYVLLRHFFLDISSIASVDIYSVTGNESRAKDELGFSKITASDNYDVTIMQMLKIAFEDSNVVNFYEGDPSEQVINIDGINFLLMHGTTLGTSNSQAKITQVIGKYALKGIIIRYVFFGHVHSTYLSDWYARSSSLGGSNTYNENALHLIGRAGQNMFILHNGSDILDGIKVDLQGEFGEGYPIKKELESYHTKSADKLKPKHSIMEVVV